MTTLMLLLALGTTPEQRQIAVAPAETLSVELWGPPGLPTIVLIADFLGSTYTFRHVAAALGEAGYRVVVVEPLAVGTSSRPKQADYSLAAQARRVAAVLDSCGVGAAIVGAQGTSGAVAVRLAAARPEMVTRLVLLEGGGASRAAGPGFRRAMENSAGLQFFPGLMRAAIRKGMIAASGDPSWVTDEVVHEYTRGGTIDMGATVDAYRAIARARDPDDIADRVAEVRVPVLLLLGGAKHSAGPPKDEVRMLVARLVALSIDTVPGAGHHLAEERPDRVVEALMGSGRLAARLWVP
jgi:pimeloyl-ACP methyl ester carboxylesterase